MAGFYNPYVDVAATNPWGNTEATLGFNTGQAGKGAVQQIENPNPAPYGYQKPKGNGVNAGQIIGGIGAAASTFGKQTADPMDFSVDPWAGYTGSAAGFTSGGTAGAIIGGAVAQLDTFNKVHANLDKLNDGVTTTERDALGRPLYSGVDVTNAQRNIDALKAGQKAIDNESFDPATHVISWIRGTGRELKRKRRNLTNSIQSGQKEYNRASANYSKNQLVMDQYNKLQNKDARLKSLYNIGNNPLY